MTTPFTPAIESDWDPQCQQGGVQRVRPLRTKIAEALASVARICRHRLRLWNARINERAFLRDLHECELREMGLSFDDRCQEVNKPFWRA